MANAEDIYVFIDGPQKGVEQSRLKVESTISKIYELFQWCPRLTIHKSDYNYGAGYGPKFAIDWFFQNVTEGIILEEDCIPTSSFIDFCAFMINKYRNEYDVGCISGHHVTKRNDLLPRYTFISIPLIWGWATWRDRWQKLKLVNETDQLSLERSIIKIFAEDNISKRFWLRLFQRLRNENSPIWDYAWTATSFIHSFKSILPYNSLITNVGFGDEATNTKDMEPRFRAQALEVPHSDGQWQFYEDSSIDRLIMDNNFRRKYYRFPDFIFYGPHYLLRRFLKSN